MSSHVLRKGRTEHLCFGIGRPSGQGARPSRILRLEATLHRRQGHRPAQFASHLYTPSGNVTILDYGRNDFERGDRFSYDLELHGISALEDVTLVSVSKAGNDDWCVAAMEPLIDSRRVFDQRFRDASQQCRWLSSHTVSHEALRAHADWQNFVQTFPLLFDRDEIESRIETIVEMIKSGREPMCEKSPAATS